MVKRLDHEGRYKKKKKTKGGRKRDFSSKKAWDTPPVADLKAASRL